MRIESLSITRRVWLPGQPLEGEIKFANAAGAIAVRLDDEKCRAMLEVVADAVVAQAQATAAILRDNIIESVAETKLLEQSA